MFDVALAFIFSEEFITLGVCVMILGVGLLILLSPMKYRKKE